MKKDVKKLVLAAVFAALTCALTMVIKIPTPGTGGYIHPGDAMVVLCGVLLGPWYGFFAAGIGSMLADLLGGYFVYVPATFLIKGLIAYLAGYFYRKAIEKNGKPVAGVVLGGIADIVLVAGGYFLFEFFLYGISGAAVSILPNVVQGISGLVLSLVLYPVLSAIPDVRYMNAK